MTQVAVVGLGFMGVTHFYAWKHVEMSRVSAICTRDPVRRSGDWSGVRGNFGPAGGHPDLTGVSSYGGFEDVLADPAIALVDLCVPTPQHPDMAIRALEAGKHVLVEKPIALTPADAQRMIDAAERTGRVLMVAHVLRFWPEWAYLKDAAAQARWGRLLAVNLQRVIGGPTRPTPGITPGTTPGIAAASGTASSPAPASGGPLIDLHIHDADFLLYLAGRPRSVYATGVTHGQNVRYLAATYAYADGPIASAQSGALAPPARTFQHGYEAVFEHAVVRFTHAVEKGEPDPASHQSARHRLTVYHADGTVTWPAIDDRDPFVPQLEHAAACAASGTPSPILGPQSAHDALTLVLKAGQSIQTGTPIDTGW